MIFVMKDCLLRDVRNCGGVNLEWATGDRVVVVVEELEAVVK